MGERAKRRRGHMQRGVMDMKGEGNYAVSRREEMWRCIGEESEKGEDAKRGRQESGNKLMGAETREDQSGV